MSFFIKRYSVCAVRSPRNMIVRKRFKVNSEDPLYSHVTNRIVCQWNYFYLLLRLFWPGFEPRSPTYNGTALPPEPMRWSMIYDALAHIASRHSNQSFGVWLSAWVTNVHFADWFSRLLNRFSTLLKELSKCWLIRCLFVCLFVCLGFIVPLENFSLVCRRHHYRWRAANFDLCSALMAIEQWGCFSVPYLLWHGESVYNGPLRGPVTLKPIAERLAVKLSLPIFTTFVFLSWIRTPNLPHGKRINPLRHRRAP